ncbi:MAG: lipopolysaccharide biosynthesis protein [Planctomycetia bacterium]
MRAISKSSCGRGDALSPRKNVFKGAAILSAGQGLGRILSFVRNLIVARLVTPEDFGIAATFAITVSVFEMISDLGSDKLIIQAKDGDNELLQATAQSWLFVRGLMAAIFIAGLAKPISRLFDVPEAQWAFMVLGLVPLMRGLAHLDRIRLQRGMRFGPQVAAEAGSQLVATLSAWPLAAWLGDYSAMLWLVILQAGSFAIISHAFALRRYRWAWDRGSAHRLVTFGWPLLVNGLLMFGILQGDRLVVGSMYSIRDLGLYSVAAALTMTPTMVLASLSTSLLLPLFSEVQDAPERLCRRYRLSVQLFSGLSGLTAVGFILAGQPLLVLFFGSAYEDAGTIIAALAIMQGARLLRIVPTVAAMARSDTSNSMMANLFRIAALPLALLAAWFHLPIFWIAVAGAAGELLGLLYSLSRLQRKQSLRVGIAIGPVLVTAACITGAFFLEPLVSHSIAKLIIALLVIGCVLLLGMSAFDESRSELRRAAYALLRYRPVLLKTQI